MDYLKGKGAQINTTNRFSKQAVSLENVEGIDEELLSDRPKTQLFYETPKKIVSLNNSPDVALSASINPYQGCEHGCVYCYARNSHEYWGFSAGLDFETKIIVKPEAPKLLEKTLLHQSWKPQVVMLSGNTDCYQPLEQKMGITRELLKVFLKYRNPVSIITKNALVTRDLDILKDLASENLVHVFFSINSQNEDLRRRLEPRTASATKKFKAMEQLSNQSVPTGVMNAPIIPGLNHHEIPSILKSASEAGANFAGYTVVRLNGQIATIFQDWLSKNFPDRATKVWNQIQEMHGGDVKDSRFRKRMSGEGKIAESVRMLFNVSKRKYFQDRHLAPLDTSKFLKGGNLALF